MLLALTLSALAQDPPAEAPAAETIPEVPLPPPPPAPPEEPPEPTADELWKAWLAHLGDLLGSPTPTQEHPIAEMVLLTDQQVKFLGGHRTSLQSLTSDAAVDVAIRPIAQDLFSFAPSRILRRALREYRDANTDRRVTYVDTGDLVDLACRKELELVFAGPLLPLPDLITTGNHDFNYAGNFRMNSDLFGASYFSAGGDIKGGVWGPSCGGTAAASHSHEPAVSGATDARKAAMGVILEKNAFSEQVSSWMMGDDIEPVLITDVNKGGFTPKGGKFTPWTNTAAIVDTFWKEGERGTWVGWAELDKTCVGPPKPGCRESGRTHLLVSAARIHPEREYWVLGIDSADQTVNNLEVPGLYASYSKMQTEVLRSFMNARRLQADDAHPARFVLASHFPLDEVVAWKNYSRSDLLSLLSANDVMFMVEGHTHTPAVEMVTFQNVPVVAKARPYPLVEYVAGSTLDFPVGGMRVSLLEEVVNDKPVLRPVAHHFRVTEPAGPIRTAVEAELIRHRHALVSYRSAGMQQRTWRWERGTARSSMLTAFRRMMTAHRKIDELDTRPLMEHQFHELIAYLDSVVALLEQDGNDPAVVETRKQLRALLDAMKVRRTTWKPATEADQGRRHPMPTDLFAFECDAAVGAIPDGRFFKGAKNCVEAVQHTLRRVPTDTLAFEFMLRMALRAALAEHCSNPMLKKHELPAECQTVFHVGAYAPLK